MLHILKILMYCDSCSLTTSKLKFYGLLALQNFIWYPCFSNLVAAVTNKASLSRQNIKCCNNLALNLSQQLHTRPQWATDIPNQSLRYSNNKYSFNFINIIRNSSLLSSFLFGFHFLCFTLQWLFITVISLLDNRG